MFFKKKDKVRDKLVFDLIKEIQEYHKEYHKLLNEYKDIVDKYTETSKEYGKLMMCVTDYLSCGASERFKLLLKEHAIGEKREENKEGDIMI